MQRQLETLEVLDFTVRWVQDRREDERVAGVRALLECLEVKAQRDDLFDSQRTPTGAVVSTQILLNAKPAGDWKTLDKYGLSRESTVADMFAAMSGYTDLHDRALVLA